MDQKEELKALNYLIEGVQDLVKVHQRDKQRRELCSTILLLFDEMKRNLLDTEIDRKLPPVADPDPEC